MSKDLHDIDDLFRAALEDNEQNPSASVKENLLAQLDKKDAESYKKRFLIWKTAAIVLLLLLGGFVLFETAIRINNTGDANQKNVPVADKAKKSETGSPAQEAINSTDAGNTTMNKSGDDGTDVVAKKETGANENSSDYINELKAPKQKENGKLNTAKPDFKNLPPEYNQAEQKKKQAAARNQRRSLFVDKKMKTVISPAIVSNKTDNIIITPDENLLMGKRNFAINSQKISLTKIENWSFAGMWDMHRPDGSAADIQLKMSAIIDSFLKSNVAKNHSLNRIHHFKPYWTLTAQATYDRVNYKLDSDLPDNITTIQHREIHEPSFSAGLLVARQLKQQWGLQTGVVYSNIAIGISAQKIYALQDPAGDIAYKYITSSGYAYIKPGFGAPPAFGDSLTVAEAKHRLQSVSIPVIIKHTIGKNKFLFIPGAGVEGNFITGAKLVTEIEDAANRETVFINKLNGAKSFYWSLSTEAELRYIANKKLSFSIRPVFRYALSPITENNVVETFPYSFGAGLGLTYKF